MVIGYILATGLVYGTALLVLLAGATRMLGALQVDARLHHLTQGADSDCGRAACSSACPRPRCRCCARSMCRCGGCRICASGLLAIANLWSAWLAWRVTRRYSERFVPRAARDGVVRRGAGRCR